MFQFTNSMYADDHYFHQKNWWSIYEVLENTVKLLMNGLQSKYEGQKIWINNRAKFRNQVSGTFEIVFRIWSRSILFSAISTDGEDYLSF